MRYIRGHVGNLKKRDRLDESLWHTEDRGYLTPCWIWNGHVNKRTGYCRVKFMGKFRLPHRVMYEQEVGAIPAAYDVDHLCRQRQCVRPTHLEAVTRAENIRRSRTARLTPEDVAFIRGSSLTHARLARLFVVNPQTIADIRASRTWRE